jgi:hypothetical protein
MPDARFAQKYGLNVAVDFTKIRPHKSGHLDLTYRSNLHTGNFGR